MTTYTNLSGTKEVKITIDGAGNINALYVQIYNSEQDVLQAKQFSTIKRAETWAKKILAQ